MYIFCVYCTVWTVFFFFSLLSALLLLCSPLFITAVLLTFSSVRFAMLLFYYYLCTLLSISYCPVAVCAVCMLAYNSLSAKTEKKWNKPNDSNNNRPTEKKKHSLTQSQRTLHQWVREEQYTKYSTTEAAVEKKRRKNRI